VKNQRARVWKQVVLAVAVVGLLRSPTMGASAPASQAEGTVRTVEGGALTLVSPSGSEVRIAVAGDTVVLQRQSVPLDTIKPNDFVGVTARREADGSLTALAINIFPSAFRGRVREAQFVMDTGNIMTNATVFQNVRRIEGRTLYLKLGDGSVIVAVPTGAEVSRLTVMKAADLSPGMRVVVRGTAGADGTLAATTITVDAR
jgi:hypothetical protein